MYSLYYNTMSPYSMKAVAMAGYAGLACELRTQNVVTRYTVLKRLTGKTMVPVLRRGEWAMGDSTAIAEYLQKHYAPSLLPADADLEPLCWLLEEFADEWLSRWMIFSRWMHEPDATVLADEIGRELTCGLPLVGRAAGRLAVTGIKAAARRAGVDEANRQAFEQSRDRLLQAFEHLFAGGPGFVFGSRPTVADFAFYGQLLQYDHDPTGHRRMRVFPNTMAYVERIDRMALPEPEVEQGEAGQRDLADLEPVFAEFLGTYWRALVRNFEARAAGVEGLVDAEMLDGSTFTFRPSGYMVGRLKFVLGQLDRAYARREALFGPKGLALEHALVSQIGRLVDLPAGRQLLRDYSHIGR